MRLVEISQNQANSSNWISAISANEFALSPFLETYSVTTMRIQGDRSNVGLQRDNLDIETLFPYLVSEDVLAREWNMPEEDIAWRDL